MIPYLIVDRKGEDRFIPMVENALNIKYLERIHQSYDALTFSRETDQSTPFHTAFYRLTETDHWKRAYERFIHDEVVPLFGDDVVYQTVPTFRVHFPFNVGVGERHTDAMYGHYTGMTNIIIPLTSMYGTAGVFIEKILRHTREIDEISRFVFNPDVGNHQMLVFDGAMNMHWNEPNEEHYTRVSIDIRVCPVSAWMDTGRESINTKKKFTIGDYYSKTGS